MGTIPEVYTCEGAGINPALEFHNVPESTISLVLIMDDPDVPSSVRPDNMWAHWVVWNIDPRTIGVDENSEPDGVHGMTTSQTKQYVRPCPPDREHRYFFRLYALDTDLHLPEGSTKTEVVDAMEGHIIEQAELVGLYCKQENR